uniref:Putative DNA binding, helix-turn-helix domain containing protein n=1 Tax=viral metagenome TaxID=1070528 RepID=A0A6H1ZII8_9ZZZZ
MSDKLIFGDQEESMYKLARRTMFTETQLSQYRHGKCAPSLANARKLAEALGYPLDNLIFKSEQDAG